ncbi:IS5 family transposase [Streptomyces globisporus]|uniref:IS5 family transposase n=1 Tax=Streptomyces globisporus TaxID=1908 RepID=UPI0036D93B65
MVDGDLWALIEALLPPWPEGPPGPRPVPDRLCLQGILFVLYKDIAWQLLPRELGFGSGQTCWRRLGRWQKAGVFDRLHRVLVAELNAVGELDWSRAWVDGSHVRAKKRGCMGLAPVDRRKTGSKHHLICDGRGIPLRVITTAANVNDATRTLALVDGIPPLAGRPGRPRRRPDALLGNSYDSDPNRKALRKRRTLPVISRKASPNVKSIGKLRYVVEQTFALLYQFKRLAVRWERRTELHDAFVSLACSLICYPRFKKTRT